MQGQSENDRVTVNFNGLETPGVWGYLKLPNGEDIEILDLEEIGGAYNCHYHSLANFLDFRDIQYWLNKPQNLLKSYFDEISGGTAGKFKLDPKNLVKGDVIALYDKDSKLIHTASYFMDLKGVPMTSNKFAAYAPRNMPLEDLVDYYEETHSVKIFRFKDS